MVFDIFLIPEEDAITNVLFLDFFQGQKSFCNKGLKVSLIDLIAFPTKLPFLLSFLFRASLNISFTPV
tara:strand:- start:3867 stop:4070 length:204 start_codon:yes stop_codon:yes gene_type:complete